MLRCNDTLSCLFLLLVSAPIEERVWRFGRDKLPPVIGFFARWKYVLVFLCYVSVSHRVAANLEMRRNSIHRVRGAARIDRAWVRRNKMGLYAGPFMCNSRLVTPSKIIQPQPLRLLATIFHPVPPNEAGLNHPPKPRRQTPSQPAQKKSNHHHRRREIGMTQPLEPPKAASK